MDTKSNCSYKNIMVDQLLALFITMSLFDMIQPSEFLGKYKIRHMILRIELKYLLVLIKGGLGTNKLSKI